MLQKLVGSAGGSADFEADLKTALTSDGGPAATLVGKILKNLGATGASDQSAAEQALASGGVALQSLIILNQAGLSAADIQQLLGGEGAQVSDSGLETLLVNLGYDAEQVSAVMADSSAKAKLVEALGASLNDLIEQFCSAGGESAESLKLELAASLDQIAALPADLKSALAAQTPESKTAIAEQLGRLAEAVRAALDEKPSGEPVISAFKPLVSAPASAPDSPVAPAQVVAPAIASGQAIGVVNNRAAAAKAEKLVETATNEIGVAAEDLAEVLVSSAPEDRAAAVSAVTSQVRSYFENHQDEKLSPKVRDSLELIRSGMSENEFAPIDEALQAFSGIHLKEVATPLNSQVLQAAAQQLQLERVRSLQEVIAAAHERLSEQHIIDTVLTQLPELYGARGTAVYIVDDSGALTCGFGGRRVG